MITAAGWRFVSVFRDIDVAVVIVVAVWVVIAFLQVLDFCPEVRAIVVIFLSKLVGDEC